MNRAVQAVVLLLFGGAIVRTGVTDLALRYVKEGLRPFVVAAGLLLVAVALATLWREWCASPDKSGKIPKNQDPMGYGPEHDHERGPRAGWLLLLPVLGLLLITPPALGADAAGRAGTALATGDRAAFLPLPAGDPLEIELLDYASRAVFDDGRSLSGRTLRMTGFVTPGPDGRPLLTRIILSCCAADGQPIKIGLSGDAPSTVPADTWVRVTGVYDPTRTADAVNQAAVPYLTVQAWEEVPQPRQPYE